ncbi:MAG: TonB family protein [Burkholderiales bacterium]
MSTAALNFEREPTHLPSAALAVSVHVLLFAVLVFGVSWQSRAPETLSVELWNLPPLAEPVPSKPEAEPAPPPKLELKPAPQIESKPAPKKVDIVTEKEKKPVAKEVPVKLDLAKQMKEQLARELESVQRERERSEVLAQFKPAATPAGAPSVDLAYANRIRQKIKPHINVPPDISGNPEAIYDVEQLPTGEVLSVKVRKSSGFRTYDDAVERAIMKASPLPRPEKADQFQRRLVLTFRPND